jgi:hypothetical protein
MMVSAGYLQLQGAAVSMGVDQWDHLLLRAKPRLQPGIIIIIIIIIIINHLGFPLFS